VEETVYMDKLLNQDFEVERVRKKGGGRTSVKKKRRK